MNTIKLSYITSKENKDIILNYIKNQNNIFRFLYNRLQNNKILNQKELTTLSNSMNNIFVDSWFKQSAIYKAKELNEKDNIIFGGKKLFLERNFNKISKEEFKIKKLLPLYLIGEANKCGNRKFNFDFIQNNKLIFKPDVKTKIDIQLPKLRKNYKKILYELEELSNNKELPITVSLDLNFVYITYNEFCLTTEHSKTKNRIMSIDLNPNYIGYTIIDWISEDTKTIVISGCISIKEINDKQFKLKDLKVSSEDKRSKYLNNKRCFEVFEISKYLVDLAKHYKVESFGIEDLSIKSSDKENGRDYNRLLNNFWNRSKLVQNLEKRLNIYNIKLYKILPQYSSFIGNLVNREYFDPIASSIEISRRTFKFSNKLKPVVFPEFRKLSSVISRSLEEFRSESVKLDSCKHWIDLYKQVKNSKLRYRVPLDFKKFKVCRLFNKKSYLYEFISN
jgi:hypothetical protein